MISITVKGCTNPVRLAGILLKAQDLPVDEAAFERLAQTVADCSGLEGFVCESYDDLSRLCVLGEFVIWYKDGMIVPVVKGAMP